MRTTHITKPADVSRKWYVIDAEGLVLGRLSTEVARILRGKHKPVYSPFIDTGDYVIIVNAQKVRFTGNKLMQKTYVRHSGHIGRRKETVLRDVMATDPEFVLNHSVKGMMPKNNLGRSMFKKLFVYSGPEHKHAAQKPEAYTISK